MSITDKLFTIAKNEILINDKGKLDTLSSSKRTMGNKSGIALNISDANQDINHFNFNISSKNILDANTIFGQQKITELVRGDNSFTARGEVGSGIYAWDAGQFMFPYINGANLKSKGFELKAGATYTVSFNASIQEVGVYGNKITVIIYRLNNDTDGVALEYQVYGLTITLEQNNRYSFSFIPSEDTKYGLCFCINNNLMTISNIQIEKAADNTPFTPYIADTSTVGVKRWGKNLLPLSQYNINHEGLTIEYIPEEDCLKFNGSVASNTLNTNVLLYPYLLLGEVGAKYTLSIKNVGGTIEYPQGISNRYCNMFLFSSDNLPVNAAVARTSFIEMNRLTQNCYLTKTETLAQPYVWGFRFYVTKEVVFTNYKIQIQLEKNDVATEYEGYKEPVELVEGVVKHIPETFNLIPSSPDVHINFSYYKDIDKAYNELINQIALSGGE